MNTQTLRIGAHRGAMCHAPENTLAAFEKAIAFETYPARTLCPELSIASFYVRPGPFDAQEKTDDLGIDLLIVWPQTATPENIAQAKQHGLQIRCGYTDNMTYEESYTLFKQLADAGVDEFSCGRPDWIGRMIREYTL